MSAPPDQHARTSRGDDQPPPGQPPEDDGAGRYQTPPDFRVPPQDVPAELAVLGGMMQSKDVIGDVAEILGPDDFYQPRNAVVFTACIELYGQGDPVDAVTVGAALTAKGLIAKAGGLPHLHTCLSGSPSPANATYYAQIVKDRAYARAAVFLGTRITQAGHAAGDGTGDAGTGAEALDRASQWLYDAANGRYDATAPQALEGLLTATMDEIDAIAASGGRGSALSTGFADLDKLTAGLHAGQMVTIGARPSIGKSTLALDFARACSIKQQHPSVFFSLEMGRTEITMRLLSAEAKVPLHHMRNGRMSDEDWTRLARTMGDVAEAPLYVDDSPNLTMPQIHAKARRLKQQRGLSLIVVDYLQLMTSPRRTESRQQEVSEFSRALKLLAKELEVPVIALSQLNRGPEQRTDKKPMLSDLRESGGIEQDSDLVILLHREDAYERDSPRAGEADLILAKNRNGPTGTVTVAFQGHYSRFVDMQHAT